MKTKVIVLAVFAALFFLYSCSEDDPVQQQSPEKIVFSFSIPTSVTTGRAGGNDLPEGITLLISVADAAGNDVLTRHPVTIMKMGEAYITEPLMLNAANYVLTDFMVVDERLEVLYATPKRGSPLASIVAHPLPHSFSVAKNKVATVPMDVLDATVHAPADFGYAAFTISVVNPLRIAVFVEQHGKLVLTSAEATLYKGSAYVTDYDLLAKPNVLPFKSNTDVAHELLIMKDGYLVYTQTFVYDDLIEKLGDAPLNVVLTPVEEPHLSFVEPDDITHLSFTGHGQITINWGDGTSDVHSFQPDPEAENPGESAVFLSHEYENPDLKTVKITGDVNKIVGLTQFRSKEINTGYLSGLSRVYFEDAEFTTGLDLSKNTTITRLFLRNVKLGNFILPQSHRLSKIHLEDAVSNVEYIVGNIYDNAVAHNIRDGVFYFLTAEPPSEESQRRLHDLRDHYGWTIYE